MAPELDRRTLLKSSAAATGSLALSSFAHGHGAERVRIGLIGCGGRGTGAAGDCIEADPAVELVAMGDLFADRIESSKRSLAGRLENMGRSEAQKTTDDSTFAGWDAYQKVIDSDVDVIVTATPPAFRPMVFEAAIAAGKHVFMEKPVAVDPPGVRRVIAAAREAKAKNLSVVSGTQRRHQKSYLETMQRIHEGAIGEVVAAQCWWNQGGLWVKKQEPNWSDMRPPVPHPIGVRQHLRPLRDRVRVRQRRHRPQLLPADQRLRQPRRRAPGRHQGHLEPQRLDLRRERVEVRRRRQEPLRPGAHRPDRVDPQRRRAQRGRARGALDPDRDHGSHVGLHRPRALLGRGAQLRVRPDPAGLR
ncbi:MAG: Gfo/Idh/MocA family protein, partial [Planctomycetota bacterium]